MDKGNNGIVVFGAGQMRTGTSSLKKALEYLYDGKCYHMEEVLRNNGHVEIWQNILEKKKLNKETADKLFKGYCCAVDLPVAAFYKDMLELYPNAKVILTERDPDSWITSVRQTTFVRTLPTFWQSIWFYVIRLHLFFKMVYKLYEVTFDHTLDELRDDEILKGCFIKHNEAVKRIVPRENLLVFEAKQGWEPLCKFLGKKVPDIPYPMVHTATEFKKTELWINMYMASKMLAKIFIPSIVVGFSIWYFKSKK